MLKDEKTKEIKEKHFKSSNEDFIVVKGTKLPRQKGVDDL